MSYIFLFRKPCNFLIGCWALLGCPLTEWILATNNQNTETNINTAKYQGILLDESNNVFHWVTLHSLKNMFLGWQSDKFYFGFSTLTSKLLVIPLLLAIYPNHTLLLQQLLSFFYFICHPSISFKIVFACLKWEKWERMEQLGSI